MIEREGLVVNNQEITSNRNQDWERLAIFSRGIKEALGDEEETVVLIGGVALRLLEAVVGIDNGGVFSGRDIDVLYLGSDEKPRSALEKTLNQLEGLPPVDVHRLLKPQEGRRAVFRQIVQEGDNSWYLTSLLGRIQVSINNSSFEILELRFNEENSVLCASPSLLFHLYATRIPGGVKQRDWQERKYRRLLEINRHLNGNYGLDLARPSDFKDWRGFRKQAREGFFPRLIIRAVDVNDRLGRPWEKLGLATLVK